MECLLETWSLKSLEMNQSYFRTEIFHLLKNANKSTTTLSVLNFKILFWELYIISKEKTLIYICALA